MDAHRVQDAYHYLLFACDDMGRRYDLCAFEGSRDYRHNMATRLKLARKARKIMANENVRLSAPPTNSAGLNVWAGVAAAIVNVEAANMGISAHSGEGL